ncbi:hypothetical protein L9F63_023200 [Diploptera punctata]|uniref:C2H2-type domain-containing protein n=1 Tax=Diploptera punctata TaxID=6984 RepID=A0AAD7ZJS3_DIPPU|nr:hypothetical protein L9F63_023200 [Diploptera punctata]
MEVDIESEIDYHIESIDIKCELFPADDPLDYQKTKLEDTSYSIREKTDNIDIKHEAYISENLIFIKDESKVQQTEELLENLQQNSVVTGTECDPNVVSTEEDKCTGNVNNIVGIYTPNLQPKKAHNDETRNILSDDDLIPHLSKLFKCSVCKKSFTRKFNLVEHLRIHRNEKPFKCSACGKSFIRKPHLKTHIGTHDNEKRFICNLCDKSYTRKSSLNIHLRYHSNEKSFRCAVCNKTFVEKRTLKTHLRIHTNEKPFKCPVCNKSFTQKTNLNTHYRLHSKETPFK